MEWTKHRPRQVALAPYMRPWEPRRPEDPCVLYQVVRLIRGQYDPNHPFVGQQWWYNCEVPKGHALEQLRINRHAVSPAHFKAALKYTCTGNRKWKPPIEEYRNDWAGATMLRLLRNARPLAHNTYTRVEANGQKARPHSVR